MRIRSRSGPLTHVPKGIPMTYDRTIQIDSEAISQNVESLRRAVAPSDLMVVVKADGYGHGANTAARAALDGGATQLGVADIQEGLALRAAGIRAPILAWLHTPNTDYAQATAAGITLGVSSLEQLDQAVRAGAPAVHLKLDTGLSRNGIPREEVTRVFARASAWERAGRIRVTGLFTHLANASEADNAAQLEVFDALTLQARNAGMNPLLRHIGGSHGSLSTTTGRYEMVRVGIACYGLRPETRTDVAVLGLRPAMRVTAAVSSVREVPAGTGVSYDYAYRTATATRLALVPLGYADGIPRTASGSAPVFINARRHTITGRIAMDQFVVDVGDSPVRVGDTVVLWGDPAAGEPSVEEWAEACSTICYELVTRIGGRLTRAALTHIPKSH